MNRPPATVTPVRVGRARPGSDRSTVARQAPRDGTDPTRPTQPGPERRHHHLGTTLDVRRPDHDTPYLPEGEQARRAAMVVAGMAALGAAHEVRNGGRAVRAWARMDRTGLAHPSRYRSRHRALLHLHVGGAGQLATFARLLSGTTTPLVVHLHETSGRPVLRPATARAHRPIQDAGSRLLSIAQLVVVPAPEAVQVAREVGARHAVAAVGASMPVAHGLPLRPCRPAPWLWGRRIVAVGPLLLDRVAPLVEALAAQPTDTDLLLLGDGPDEPRIREIAEEMILGHRVHVLHRPTWDAVNAHLWHADAVAAVGDDPPVVLLRAMELGRPVITTAVGERRHLVSSDVDGILVPVGDRWSLAGGLRRLLVDTPLAEELGAAGARRVAARAWTDVASEILTALTEAQAGHAEA